jgi:hypothetical protein
LNEKPRSKNCGDVELKFFGKLDSKINKKKLSETVNLKNLRRFNGKIIFLNQIFGVQKTGKRIKNGKNVRFKQNLGNKNQNCLIFKDL